MIFYSKSVALLWWTAFRAIAPGETIVPKNDKSSRPALQRPPECARRSWNQCTPLACASLKCARA